MHSAQNTQRIRNRIRGSASGGFWRLLEGYRLLFTGAVLSQAIAVGCETTGFFLLRYFIDGVIVKQVWTSPFYLIALGYIALALIRGIFSFFSGRGGSRTAEGIAREIREALYDHTQRLSFAYHDKMQTGELIQRSTSDVDTVRRFYGEQVMGISNILFLFSVNFISLLFLEWHLALVSVVSVPLIIAVSTVFFRKIFRAYDAYQEQDAIVSIGSAGKSIGRQSRACFRPAGLRVGKVR